jgi:hypothetical protein
MGFPVPFDRFAVCPAYLGKMTVQGKLVFLDVLIEKSDHDPPY